MENQTYSFEVKEKKFFKLVNWLSSVFLKLKQKLSSKELTIKSVYFLNPYSYLVDFTIGGKKYFMLSFGSFQEMYKSLKRDEWIASGVDKEHLEHVCHNILANKKYWKIKN